MALEFDFTDGFKLPALEITGFETVVESNSPSLGLGEGRPTELIISRDGCDIEKLAGIVLGNRKYAPLIAMLNRQYRQVVSDTTVIVVLEAGKLLTVPTKADCLNFDTMFAGQKLPRIKTMIA
jgi:hypothetical protein